MSVVSQAEIEQRIQQVRERVGMSQRDFAEAVGKDQKAIYEYETGKRKVSAVELAGFARVLGVPVSYFYEGDFKTNELDQMLLQEFHSLPSDEDRKTAIQSVRFLSDATKRHTPSS
jgi:transcriptional regulator with XRE-family HTH domain